MHDTLRTSAQIRDDRRISAEQWLDVECRIVSRWCIADRRAILAEERQIERRDRRRILPCKPWEQFKLRERALAICDLRRSRSANCHAEIVRIAGANNGAVARKGII